MIYISYYLVIIFSLLGYGFILSKLLDIRYVNFGYLGLIGLTFLTFFSYATTLFFVHNYFFNVLVIFLGIVFFILNYKKKFNFQLFLTTTIFIFLIIFILVSKNHDDFSYYHYPYSHFLTQFKHPIGFGWVNEGFRNHSSIFFLNSLFYLPYIEHYLLHISPTYFLGFANVVLITIVFDKRNYSSFKFISLFALLCVCFLNIFFYRLAEHGTDRSGQVLTFLVVAILITIISEKYKNNKIDIFKICSLILVLLISLKTFYLLYAPLILLIDTPPVVKSPVHVGVVLF